MNLDASIERGDAASSGMRDRDERTAWVEEERRETSMVANKRGLDRVPTRTGAPRSAIVRLGKTRVDNYRHAA